jgi:hypothetical protein
VLKKENRDSVELGDLDIFGGDFGLGTNGGRSRRSSESEKVMMGKELDTLTWSFGGGDGEIK